MTLENPRLTPEERIRQLDDFIAGVVMMNAPSNLNPAVIHLIENQLRLLGSFGVECVIIGGVASSIYASALLTRDLDL